MYYYQEITYIEHKSGRQTIRFAVTDTITELFTNDIANKVNIYNLSTIKQDLNLGEGKFAVDEISFTINQSECNDTLSSNALAFTLQCQNNIRYCAVNLLSTGEEPNTDNCLIIAKLEPNIDATDIAWNCVDYSSDINAVRSYSFKSLSLDISLLDECLFNDEIKKGVNTVIPNVYDRITNIDINSITKFKTTSYFRKPLYIQHKYQSLITGYYPYKVADLAPLGKVINLYLKKAELIIQELHNVSMKFRIAKSNIGLFASPALYDIQDAKIGNRTSEINQTYVDTNVAYNLYLGLNDTELDTSQTELEPYISSKMVKADYGFAEWLDPYLTITNPTPNADALEVFKQEKDRIKSAEQPHTFQSFKSVSDLLFKIANEFNCYIKTSTSIINNELVTDIKFVSKVTFNNTNVVTIANAIDAGTNTTYNNSDEIIYYYSVVNASATETLQLLPSMFCYGYPYRSQKDMPNSENETIRNIEEYKLKEIGLTDAKLTKSLFTTTLVEVYTHTFITDDTVIQIKNGEYQNGYFAGNSRPINTFLDINDIPEVMQNDIRQGYSNTPPIFTQLTTNLYLHSPFIEQQQLDIINGSQNTKNHKPTRLMRPIARYYIKINNSTISDELGEGTTLTEILNATSGYERDYYKSEYSITVPYWNGFVKNNDTNNISWKNVELGSIIKLNNIDYVVVSKEISLDKPLTNIKLQSISRFSYNMYEG